MFLLLLARVCITDLCFMSQMLLQRGSFTKSVYLRGRLSPRLRLILTQLLFTMSISIELIQTVSGFSFIFDSLRWLKTQYFSLRICILGINDLPQVVRRGESTGGKNSLIFLSGEKEPWDISIKLITIFNRDKIQAVLYEHLNSVFLFLNIFCSPFDYKPIQIEFMLKAAKDKVSHKITSVKDFFVSIGQWILSKYRKHKKKCRGILLSLAILVLLVGLIMGSYKSVNSVSQGVPINYSQGTIVDSTVSNYGSFVGLNTYYYTVPATNFLVTFNSGTYQSGQVNSYPSIQARAIEGIKIEIDVDAKVKLVPTNLKSFLEDYGINLVDEVHAGWQIYIKEKIKNVVVQTVALYKFYQITNQALAAAINSQFTSYSTNTQLNYPFRITIIGISIHYPDNTMELNNTLGIKLLKEASKLGQLSSQLTTLKSYKATYQAMLENYYTKKATIDGSIASREQAVKIASPKWIEGVQILNSTLQNSTLLQKYLEIYFNSLYNVTYRLETVAPFII